MSENDWVNRDFLLSNGMTVGEALERGGLWNRKFWLKTQNSYKRQKARLDKKDKRNAKDSALLLPCRPAQRQDHHSTAL